MKKFTKLALVILLSHIATNVWATNTTLYEQLGGKDAIKVVVDDFVQNVAADKRINYFFKNSDIAHLKQMLVDQMCMATGGPCEYKGRSMDQVHKDMGVKELHFNALAEDLYKALDDNGVPYHMQNKVMAILAPLKKVVVQ